MKDLKSKQIFFDKQSAIYDKTRIHLHGYAKKWINLIDIHPGKTVLSIGCGTGENFQFINQKLKDSGQIIGVDFSPGMISVARQKVVEQGLINVTLYCEDGGEFISDTPIDIAIFAFSIFSIPKYRKAIQNTWDALNKGGQMIIVDYKKSNHPVFKFLNPFWIRWSNHFHGDFSRTPWTTLNEISGNLEFIEYSFGFKYFAKSIKY